MEFFKKKEKNILLSTMKKGTRYWRRERENEGNRGENKCKEEDNKLT